MAGSVAWIFAIPPTMLDHIVDRDVRSHGAGFLRAPEERLAGAVERSAAALEDFGVAVGNGEELVGKRVLGGDIADEAV